MISKRLHDERTPGPGGEGDGAPRSRQSGTRPRAGSREGSNEIGRGAVVDGVFELGELLGEGSKARVHEAFDLRLERRVAVKLGKEARWASSERPLRDEARALARVRHPAFPAVHHGGVWADREYLVAELVPGIPLASYLGARRQGGGPIAVAEALALLGGLAEGLAALHEAGFAHGGVSPENVLLTHDRRPVYVGLSPRAGRSGAAVDALSRPSRGVSPEALLGLLSPDGARAADVYALGTLAFEVVAGQAPFASSSAADMLERRVWEPAPPVSYFRKGLPPSLTALLADMLDTCPERRPTAARVFERLAPLRESLETESGRPFTVLIVDPDAEAADTLRLCVEWADDAADVVVGATGEWALGAMETRSPDVVLFDLTLPDMSGLEMCMLARGNGLAGRSAMVAVGDRAAESDVALLRSLGVREFVAKGPGLLVSLPRLLKSLLDEAARQPSGDGG